MELIDVPQKIARDLNELVVSHASTALTRGLELEEIVLLRDEDGRCRSARVADLEFTATDTRYRMVLGAPLPEPGAEEEAGSRPDGPVGVDDVVDLLEELRRLRRTDEGPLDPLARILLRA